MSEAGSAAEVQAEEVELLDEYSLPDEVRSALPPSRESRAPRARRERSVSCLCAEFSRDLGAAQSEPET